MTRQLSGPFHWQQWKRGKLYPVQLRIGPDLHRNVGAGWRLDPDGNIRARQMIIP